MSWMCALIHSVAKVVILQWLCRLLCLAVCVLNRNANKQQRMKREHFHTELNASLMIIHKWKRKMIWNQQQQQPILWKYSHTIIVHFCDMPKSSLNFSNGTLRVSFLNMRLPLTERNGSNQEKPNSSPSSSSQCLCHSTSNSVLGSHFKQLTNTNLFKMLQFIKKETFAILQRWKQIASCHFPLKNIRCSIHHFFHRRKEKNYYAAVFHSVSCSFSFLFRIIDNDA